MRYRAVRVLVFFSLLSLPNCAVIQKTALSEEEKYHHDLLVNAATVCRGNRGNEVLAKKKCFPLLTNKPVSMTLRRVESDYSGDITLVGYSVYEKILCRPTEKLAKEIEENPEMLKLGEKYVVSGEFVQFRVSAASDLFTLRDYEYSFEECSFAPYKLNPQFVRPQRVSAE